MATEKTPWRWVRGTFKWAFYLVLFLIGLNQWESLDGTGRTVVWTGAAVFFATTWYLDRRLRDVHDKLDRLLSMTHEMRYPSPPDSDF